jgi:hypothetical protein
LTIYFPVQPRVQCDSRLKGWEGAHMSYCEGDDSAETLLLIPIALLSVVVAKIPNGPVDRALEALSAVGPRAGGSNP